MKSQKEEAATKKQEKPAMIQNAPKKEDKKKTQEKPATAAVVEKKEVIKEMQATIEKTITVVDMYIIPEEYTRMNCCKRYFNYLFNWIG